MTTLPPPSLWRMYFPTATVEGEDPSPASADEEAHPGRLILYARLRSWVRSSGAFALLSAQDVLASHGAVSVAFAALQRGEGAPFRRSEHLGCGDLACTEILDALALAVHDHLLERCPPPPEPENLRSRLRAKRLRIRAQGLAPPTSIRSLKADKIGALVCVRGSVIRVSPLRPLVTAMSFHCPRCGAKCSIPLADGRYEQPAGCPARGCRAKALLANRRQSSTRDWQKLRLQEVPEPGAADALAALGAADDSYGRVPRTAEVELTDDLIDCCVPGDHLEVVGIVKSMEVPNDGGSGRFGGGSNRPRCMYVLYVEAVSVRNTRSSQRASADGAAGADTSDGSPAAAVPAASLGGGEEGDARLNLTNLDLQAIRDIATSLNVGRALARRLGPAEEVSAEPDNRCLSCSSARSAPPSLGTRWSRRASSSPSSAAALARPPTAPSASARTSTSWSWATRGWARRRGWRWCEPQPLLTTLAPASRQVADADCCRRARPPRRLRVRSRTKSRRLGASANAAEDTSQVSP